MDFCRQQWLCQQFLAALLGRCPAIHSRWICRALNLNLGSTTHGKNQHSEIWEQLKFSWKENVHFRSIWWHIFTFLYQRLYQLGARKMIFHGLGPLGCIPSQRVKSKKGQCLKQVNNWILQFNSNVQSLINTLNHRLPNAKLAFADTYPLVLELINNPSAYGNLASLLNKCLCQISKLHFEP